MRGCRGCYVPGQPRNEACRKRLLEHVRNDPEERDKLRLRGNAGLEDRKRGSQVTDTLHDYFNPATGQWDEAGLTADLEILHKRKEVQPTEPAGADLSNQAAGPVAAKHL
eukprot:962719-Amphidinium_carterae.1